MCGLSFSVRFYASVSLASVHYKIIYAYKRILSVSLRRRTRKVKKCCRTTQDTLQETSASTALFGIKKGNVYLIKEKASGINNVVVLCTGSVPSLCRNGGCHIPRSILITKDGAPISSWV